MSSDEEVIMNESKKTLKGFIHELKEFLGILHSYDATELEWEKDGYGIKLSRKATRSHGQAPVSSNGKNRAKVELFHVVSPVVGTFHFLPEMPQVGALLKPGQALGYVRAVNVQHTIDVEKPGKLSEIHAQEGQPVEFGQLLFTIENERVS